jgi:glycosyltransferase involved in cell wall biosynthesis
MSPISAGMLNWSGRLWRFGLHHHLFGIGGQVAAAAPTLVVAIMLSHTVGLVPAGQFVIAAGAAALIFTTANLGLVYYISVERLRDFDPQDYVFTRAITMVIGLAVLFAASTHLGVPRQLVLLVAMLQAGNAAVDLAWGFDLLRHQTTSAMQRYTVLNVSKLIVTVVPGLMIFVTDAVAPVPMLIVGSGVAAIGCWIWLIWLPRGDRAAVSGNQLVRSARLARRAVWFTLNASSSAAIVSTPRLLLDRFYVGDPLGVVGVTLAFSQAFSMAFMSSWLRWFPRLSQAPENERKFSGMLLESLAMAALFLLLNVTVMPWVVSLMFGLKLPEQGPLTRDVLLASTLFGFSLNMSNLFKVTRAVYLESVTYIVGIAAGLLCGNNRALFLRTTARPVSRVVRMMTVARDAGFDPVFVGAFRDKAVLKEDCWEGFPVRRVGQPFPLLNGKRPLVFVRCVLSCNIGYLRMLWKEHPPIVHASDIETMPAAVIYRLTHRCRLIFNVHDNLAQRYSLPGWINACLNAVEGIAALLSDVTLVPEPFRRTALPSWCRHKVVVIRNLPRDDGPQSAPPPFENGKMRLFYGGWLDWQRGIEALLTLGQEPDIELRIAGEGAAEIVERIKQFPQVAFLGFLSSAAVMDETLQSHFVPVLYDPSRIINRFAASNKLAETLSAGRPMILNEEMEIAKDLAGGPGIINTPYAQAAMIAPRLRALANDPEAYKLACDSARQLYDTHYDWAKVRRDSLLALTGG